MSSDYTQPRRRELDNAIYGIANGEEEALKALYELSSSAVYAYALTITGNVYDAQDVMQETYLKVYYAAPNYISNGKPMSWILRIAKNLCYDRFRQQSRQIAFNEEHLTQQLVTVADATDRLVITSCLTELDEDERMIVVMHAVGGVKHREIASELGLSINTVLSKYKRALAKLQSILKGEQ